MRKCSTGIKCKVQFFIVSGSKDEYQDPITFDTEVNVSSVWAQTAINRAKKWFVSKYGKLALWCDVYDIRIIHNE